MRLSDPIPPLSPAFSKRQEMDDRTRAMREASYQQMAALQNDNEAAAAAFAATGREKDDALRSQEAEMANMHLAQTQQSCSCQFCARQ